MSPLRLLVFCLQIALFNQWITDLDQKLRPLFQASFFIVPSSGIRYPHSPSYFAQQTFFLSACPQKYMTHTSQQARDPSFTTSNSWSAPADPYELAFILRSLLCTYQCHIWSQAVWPASAARRSVSLYLHIADSMVKGNSFWHPMPSSWKRREGTAGR